MRYTDAELQREVNSTFIDLIRFENGVRALPSENPEEIFVAQGMREKMARFDREIKDRAAERN